MRVKGDGKPVAAMSGTAGLGGRVQATCLPQGRMTRCALTSLLEVGPYVPDTIKPGTYVVATVR
jgi:hypothetical protein